MEIILTHDNADFDAIASLFAAKKLYPAAQAILAPKINSNIEEFLLLYGTHFPFLKWDELDTQGGVSQIILTDTQNRMDLRHVAPDTPTLIFDHHPLRREPLEHETWFREDIGSTTTLLVERLIALNPNLAPIEATLLLLGIYEDTGLLSYSSTTPRDLLASAWLLEQGGDLETVRRFLQYPLNDAQKDLYGQLNNATEIRNVHGYPIALAHTQITQEIDGISQVVYQLNNKLDSSAIIVLVKMPEHIQMICRSQDNAISCQMIAQHLNGNGHSRAASARIYDQELDQVKDEVWAYLNQEVQEAEQVADIMSYGVQTVHQDDLIANIITRIRKIGHEGFPVINQDRQVVGLLSHRNAERALEHQLEKVSVKDVMDAGEFYLEPSASIYELENLMVESSWGQIPIVDSQQKIIGIVTRTDLIKHWAAKHPQKIKEQPKLYIDDIQAVLGVDNAEIIQKIAEQARQKHKKMYLVGGSVRDILLKEANIDLDFVIEGDAIAFAESLCEKYGGEIHAYHPFGTAKWFFSAEALLGKAAADIEASPSHIDFATARNEFYQHPTALPTVYNSSIKLDLYRRDFTINTLAVQVSPEESAWRILDYYGGLHDLQQGIIRVLHSLSFVDDPTRILRAVRFSERLHFKIEQRTKELMQMALPMMRRITGERVRNEISLLLAEPKPEMALKELHDMGVLEAIFKGFVWGEENEQVFIRERQQKAPFVDQEMDLILLRWHFIMARLAPEKAYELGERLLFGKPKAKSFMQVAEALAHLEAHFAKKKASDFLKLLDSLSAEAMLCIWYFHMKDGIGKLIEQFYTEWKAIKPAITGTQLKAMGLPEGPLYSQILAAIKAAYIDGEIQNAEEENLFLTQWIQDHHD